MTITLSFNVWTQIISYIPATHLDLMLPYISNRSARIHLLLILKRAAMVLHAEPYEGVAYLPDNPYQWMLFCREACEADFLASDKRIHPYWDMLLSGRGMQWPKTRAVYHRESVVNSMKLKEYGSAKTVTVCTHPYQVDKCPVASLQRTLGQNMTLYRFRMSRRIEMAKLNEVRLFDCRMVDRFLILSRKLVLVRPRFEARIMVVYVCSTFVLRNAQGTLTAQHESGLRIVFAANDDLGWTTYRTADRPTVMITVNGAEVLSIVAPLGATVKSTMTDVSMTSYP